MTARLTANLVLGCVLSAVAAGCTVHTYSGRPEHPGTVFVRQEPRYQVAYRSERSRERATYRPTNYRAEHTRRDVDDNAKRNERETQTKRDTRTPDPVSSKPPRERTKTVKPSGHDKDEEPVVLMPSAPDKAKPATRKSSLRSLRERLKQAARDASAEVAERESERRARMSRMARAANDNSD